MKQRYIVIDVEYCSDCNNCFIACKDEFVMNPWPPYSEEQPRHGHRWMNIMRKERGQFPRVEARYLPMPCQHCVDAPCANAAPDAVTIREDGIVLIDPVKAKGNKQISESCPYGAVYWNDEQDIPQKCTMCAHLLDGDWEMPRCVHSCPTDVLQYYYLEPEDFEKIIANEKLEVFLPELGLKTHVYYKNLYLYAKSFIAGCVLKNGDCAEDIAVSVKEKAEASVQKTNFFGEFKIDGLDPGEYTVVVDGKEIKKVTIDASMNIGVIEI